MNGRNSRTAIGLALAMFATVANADYLTYQNGRFGVEGRVLMDFVAGRAPDNGDGRTFTTAKDAARITIYGKYNLEDSFADYRHLYKTQLLPGEAEITLDRGDDSWFVLSGFFEHQIFYVRAIEGMNCEGETVLAHWVIEYDRADRATYDDQIGWLAKGLKISPC